MANKGVSSAQARKNLETQMVKYNLSAKDVFLAYLIAAGMPGGDAFVALYDVGITGKDRACESYMASKPTLGSLVSQLCKGGGRSAAAKFDLRSKDGVIDAMQTEYETATDPKQRTDILNKIADLQQLKKDEDKEREKLVHYYIALRCEQCPALPYLKKMMGEAEGADRAQDD